MVSEIQPTLSAAPVTSAIVEDHVARLRYDLRMSTPANDLRANLKSLRDRLAFAAPRARARPNAPPDLRARLDAALELVGQLYGLSAASRSASSAPSSASLDEVYEDAIVEGHLALSEWERWLEQEAAPRARARPWAAASGQRQHDRHATGVSVKLLRYSVRGEGPALTLATESVSRPAHNVSLGGIYVSAGPGEVPSIVVGSVVHVSVSALGGSRSFSARGVVTRRVDDGIALRWIAETPADQHVIEALVDAARQAGKS